MNDQKDYPQISWSMYARKNQGLNQRDIETYEEGIELET